MRRLTPSKRSAGCCARNITTRAWEPPERSSKPGTDCERRSTWKPESRTSNGRWAMNLRRRVDRLEASDRVLSRQRKDADESELLRLATLPELRRWRDLLADIDRRAP